MSGGCLQRRQFKKFLVTFVFLSRFLFMCVLLTFYLSRSRDTIFLASDWSIRLGFYFAIHMLVFVTCLDMHSEPHIDSDDYNLDWIVCASENHMCGTIM